MSRSSDGSRRLVMRSCWLELCYPFPVTVSNLVRIGNRIELEVGLIHIGRSAPTDGTASIAIPDATVSRRHCMLDVSAATVALEDIGSIVGTVVNGERYWSRRRSTLADGDVIHIGGGHLIFRADDWSLN